MMKHLLAGVVSLVLISCDPASAHGFKSELKFDAVKKVPVAVQRQTPRGFTTSNYGTSPIYKDGTKVLLHPYSLPNRKSERNPKCFQLDLFVAFKKGSRHINSIKLHEGRWARITDTQTPIAWLNVKQRKIPIIPIKIEQDSNYVHGYHVLLIFANEVAKKPIIQKFEHFDGQATRQLWFHGVDERGFIILNHETTQSLGENYNQIDTLLLYWNGQEFVRRKQE